MFTHKQVSSNADVLIFHQAQDLNLLPRGNLDRGRSKSLLSLSSPGSRKWWTREKEGLPKESIQTWMLRMNELLTHNLTT